MRTVLPPTPPPTSLYEHDPRLHAPIKGTEFKLRLKRLKNGPYQRQLPLDLVRAIEAMAGTRDYRNTYFLLQLMQLEYQADMHEYGIALRQETRRRADVLRGVTLATDSQQVQGPWVF